MSAIHWTLGWLAHFACTAVSALVQEATVVLSSQERNRPPPQMQAIWGSHSLGHQQGSVRAAQRPLAALHSHAPIAEHGIVVVAPPWPVVGPLLVMLPPQLAMATATSRTPTRFASMRMLSLKQQFTFHR
jgi:hypothetical protein